MASLYRYYIWLFDELADSRLKDWPLMGSPFPLCIIIILYLYIIKRSLPNYMKTRSAYNLKTVIRWYNILQIVGNSLLFYGLLTSGWTTTLTLGCEPTNYTTEPEAVRMLWWMYLTTLAKVFDLIETAFFVLRKKDEQASFLHIYHHVVVSTMMWIGVKYVGGGMTSMYPLVNTPVHVIMYTYYLLAGEAGPGLRKTLNKWKVWLTVIQMVQFVFLCLHSMQALAPTCAMPSILIYIFVINITVIFYLFYDFFGKTYTDNGKKNKN